MNKQTEQELLNEWKEWIEKFVIEDIKRALDGNLQVGLVILSLIGIECLGGYLNGAKEGKNSFIAFIQKYFPDDYKPYTKDIYDYLRNGLAHSYTISLDDKKRHRDKFVLFGGDKQEPHLKPFDLENKSLVSFNRKTFARDFLKAWEKYSKEIFADQDPELRKRAVKRMQSGGFLKVIGTDSRASSNSLNLSQMPGVMPEGGTLNYSPPTGTHVPDDLQSLDDF